MRKFGLTSNLKIYILLALPVLLGAAVSLILTSPSQALQSDAIDYYSMATSLSQQKFSLINLFTLREFVDVGYPFFLSLVMRIIPKNILVYQIINYIFWFGAVVLIFKSLTLLMERKKAFLASFVMALSPVFLTFPAKLYSEPLAALGVAIALFSLISYKKFKKYRYLSWFLVGTIILACTRSIFAPLAAIVYCFMPTKKKLFEYLIILVGIALIGVRLYHSYSGGRSDYNLAIQVSKLHQTYSTIGVCSVYYLSVPVGNYLFPHKRSACVQRYPSEEEIDYTQNPYYLGDKLRRNFNFSIWLQIILNDPFKYSLIVVSGMTGLIFLEGFYGSITSQFMSPLPVIFFALIKIVFAYYIWVNAIRNFLVFKRKSLLKALILTLPLIYFVVVVGNYPIEQRYFYPLLPWLYFYLSLDSRGTDKIFKLMHV